MSELKDRLRSDLTAAIKARDEVRSSTLRMVLTAVTNFVWSYTGITAQVHTPARLPARSTSPQED